MAVAKFTTTNANYAAGDYVEVRTKQLVKAGLITSAQLENLRFGQIVMVSVNARRATIPIAFTMSKTDRSALGTQSWPSRWADCAPTTGSAKTFIVVEVSPTDLFKPNS